MSTSQTAVMLCGWGVKACMAWLQVKLCVAIPERFRKRIWYLKTLYKCSGLLCFTLRWYSRETVTYLSTNHGRCNSNLADMCSECRYH